MLLTLGDPESLHTKTTEYLVGFVFESWLWMDTLWQPLIHDLRTGQVSSLVPRHCVSERGWQKLSIDIVPRPSVADKMEAVLRMLCFHSRAGKLVQTLKRLSIGKGSMKGSVKGSTKGHLLNPLNMVTTSEGVEIIPAPPRRMGELVLSREAEEAAGLQVPRDIARTFVQKPRPMSATKLEALRKEDVLKSDLVAAQYEFQTTGYNRSFKRWIDPQHDTGVDLGEDSVAGLHFVCGFPGCGHCTTTKLRTHSHYLSKHRRPILEQRATLKTKSDVEHLVAPLWPIDVPWKQEFVRKDGRVVGVRLTTAPSRSPSRGSTRTSSRGNSKSNSSSRDNSRRTTPTTSNTAASGGRVSPLGASHASTRWDKKKAYQPNQREPLGRPLFCKRPHCRARFLKFNDLYDHQREHEIQDQRTIHAQEQDGLVLQVRRPLRKPLDIVEDAFLQCDEHRFLLPQDCPMCARVEHYEQPRKPCTWYRSVKYIIPTTNEPHLIDTEDDQYQLPMIQTRRKGAVGLFPLVVVAIAVDEVGKYWIAGRLLIRLRTLLRDGTLQMKEMPKNIDLGLESVEDDVLRFVPLLEVVSWCHVGWCDPELFYMRHAPLSKVKKAPNKCCCRFQLKSGGESKNMNMNFRPETSGSVESSMHTQSRPGTSTSSVETHPRSLAEGKKLVLPL